jgi:hypothetical protein
MVKYEHENDGESEQAEAERAHQIHEARRSIVQARRRRVHTDRAVANTVVLDRRDDLQPFVGEARVVQARRTDRLGWLEGVTLDGVRGEQRAFDVVQGGGYDVLDPSQTCKGVAGLCGVAKRELGRAVLTYQLSRKRRGLFQLRACRVELALRVNVQPDAQRCRQQHRDDDGRLDADGNAAHRLPSPASAKT